jgi:DegV family protein with EDD domain
MSKVCILTDCTAQFFNKDFLGSQHVSTIGRGAAPKTLFLNTHSSAGKCDPISLPGQEANSSSTPFPNEAAFIQAFQHLERKHNEIVVILSSTQLSLAVKAAKAAAIRSRRSTSIQVIDSQTTAVGLGFLVQKAAAAVEHGLSAAETSIQIRGLLTNIYTVLCLQSLAPLAHTGLLDPAQVFVGEMLGLAPVFTLEKGRLIPTHKVNGSRQLLEIIYEFITDFDQLKHAAFVRGYAAYEQETRILRERLKSSLPSLTTSEHVLSDPAAALLGPRTLCLVALNYPVD